MRRVVVTGLGIVSCLGNNQEEVKQSLLNSKSGISLGNIKNIILKVIFMVNLILSLIILIEKVIRFMGSGSAYNYIAMKEAIEDLD